MDSTPLHPTPVTPLMLRGALDVEHTARGLLPHRLPGWARAQNGDPQLAMAESQPSGVRLAFRTRARVVELDALRTAVRYVGAPERPSGVFELLVDGALTARGSVDGGDVLEIDMATGRRRTRDGGPGTVRFEDLPEGGKDVEIWLPWNETIRLVELRTDAPVEAARPTGRPVWLHHGSSISSPSWVPPAAAGG